LGRAIQCSSYHTWIAIGLGIASQLLIVWTFSGMDKVSVVSAGLVGVIIGLASAGLYDVTKK